MTQQTDYIPGVCNINHAEIAYRRKAMYAGFGISLVLFGILVFLPIESWIRALILFLPLYVGVIGVFQVRNRFCVSYGASGKQNATDGDDTASIVEEAEARRIDKQRARTMNLQALMITVAILLVSIFIPAISL